MDSAYAELHCASSFSFLRGASQPEELVERALALEYTGLAITDECSFAGSVRAHLALKELREDDAAARAFSLIHGTEIRLVDGPTLVLLAQSIICRSCGHEWLASQRQVAKRPHGRRLRHFHHATHCCGFDYFTDALHDR